MLIWGSSRLLKKGSQGSSAAIPYNRAIRKPTGPRALAGKGHERGLGERRGRA